MNTEVGEVKQPVRWKFVIYFIGVVLLGLAYYPLEDLIPNDWIALAVAATYLLAVRGVAEIVDRRVAQRTAARDRNGS